MQKLAPIAATDMSMWVLEDYGRLWDFELKNLLNTESRA